MDLKDIKGMARKLGVKAGKMKKPEIIRAIQKAEGNFDCFGTAVAGHCTQSDCLWREDCLKM
jgi:hypothetical protein